jgi:hypothetical protein
MTTTISPRARGSPVFCISIVTAMSPILYKAARFNHFTCRTGQRSMEASCVKSPLDSGDGPQSHDNVKRFRTLNERVGRLPPPWRITSCNGLSQFLLKKGVRGRMFFWGTSLRRREHWKKVKAVTLVML